MVSRATGRGRACLLAAAACGLVLAMPARAQQTAPDPAELDPNAPLDPMPDLGVEWPDMDKPDPVPEPEPVQAGETPAAEEAADQAIEDSAAARRYTYRVDGLEAVADAAPLLERFKQQSALKKDEKHPANAAQIDRRARCRCRVADQPAAVGRLL